MNFFNCIKSYLGFSTEDDHNNINRSLPSLPQDSTRDDFKRSRESSEYVPDQYDKFGFNVFSNPLEMHRYFEHQMNETLKSFGMFGSNDSLFGNNDPFFGGSGDPFFGDHSSGLDFPALEGYNEQDSSSSLREQYLKPGYEHNKTDSHKSDKDIDEKFNMNDLRSVFKGEPSRPQIKSYMYGQSVSTQTIRKPDGSIETHRTVRDHQGNEETTVIRKQGDKEYSRTSKKDKHGEKEILENFVNLDENEIDTFLNSRKPYDNQPQKPPPNWFPFDRFFKD